MAIKHIAMNMKDGLIKRADRHSSRRVGFYPPVYPGQENRAAGDVKHRSSCSEILDKCQARIRLFLIRGNYIIIKN